MATHKRQPKDPFTKAREAAEQFGVRIGVLMHLAGLSPETEERIFASLPFLSLKDVKRVHNALEVRITMQAARRVFARFEEGLQRIATEYQEKSEDAIVEALSDSLAPELQEEYV